MPNTAPEPAASRTRGARASVALVIVLVASLLVLAPTSGASAAGGETADYLSRVNGLRSSQGLAPLILDGNLSGLAQAWAERMAAAGSIFHAPDLSAGVTTPWTKLGENVGSGPDTAHIFPAFVNSPAHYANLVDPSFTRIGIGVVWVGSVQYVVHRFLADGGGGGGGGGAASAPAPRRSPPPRAAVVTAPPTTAPAEEPDPEPAPAPAPTPAPQADQGRVAAVLDALHSLGA